jgi:UDP-glucuronate 4-epimerase
MKKILITGGAGFIGSHLAEKLVREKNRVIIVDNFDDYYSRELKKNNLAGLYRKGKITIIEEDIRNLGNFDSILARYSPDCIVHMAAKVGVRDSVKKPESYLEVNTLATQNIVHCTAKRRIGSLIFVSSSSVYGESKLPFVEKNILVNQLSPYALSKRLAEEICLHYAFTKNLPVTVVRLFSVYGPRQRPDLFISKLLHSAATGSEIGIFGDGNSSRDYIYISDVVNGLSLLIDKIMPKEIINLGTSKAITINKLIAIMEESLGIRIKKRICKSNEYDMPHTQADITKAKNLLGWKLDVDIRCGIQLTIDYMKKNLS